MSKKKNTLKDLDEFLRQQASSLVEPVPLRDPGPAGPPAAGISFESVLEDLKALSKQEGPAFRSRFYDLIIQYLQSGSPFTAEDKMLINTSLYLKSGDDWKEVIRKFWRENK